MTWTVQIREPRPWQPLTGPDGQPVACATKGEALAAAREWAENNPGAGDYHVERVPS